MNLKTHRHRVQLLSLIQTDKHNKYKNLVKCLVIRRSAQNTSKVYAGTYLSREVPVRQLWEEEEIRGQMRHNITFMCNSDCVWHIFGKVGGKSSIANTRLPKGHQMNIVTSKADL